MSAESLAATELFRGLTSRALEAVAASARMCRFPKDGLIFNQGDSEVRAHAVVEGVVRIAQSGSDGAQVVVRYIGPGEMFGTVSLFTDGHYPADAVAVCDTQVASWSEPELLALMRGYPRIAINVIRIIGKRLQEAQERMRELATQPAERRVAHAVLRLAEQVGHSTTDGTTIEFSLRRKDIADIAGTTLHTASRILTAWQKAGWLASRKQRLTVRNPTEIRRIAVSSAD
ncbi:MAG TPA: Crp/Fnr family transcriptional regulator [Steroidobacteraceae bacterium]